MRKGSALIALALVCGGCRRPSNELHVMAASSLQDLFTALERDYERQHAGVNLRFTFGGTQELRTQLEHGARADVFVSADERHMARLVKRGLAHRPVPIGCNSLVVVVRTEGAQHLQTFEDLPRAARIIAGAVEVPIGTYTEAMLEKAARGLGGDFRKAVHDRIVSRELNVRQVLAKVMLQQADAGIVYRTDALGAGPRVREIEIPSAFNVVAEYSAAVTSNSPRKAVATEWLAFIADAAPFRRELLKRGFTECPLAEAR